MGVVSHVLSFEKLGYVLLILQEIASLFKFFICLPRVVQEQETKKVAQVQCKIIFACLVYSSLQNLMQILHMDVLWVQMGDFTLLMVECFGSC